MKLSRRKFLGTLGAGAVVSGSSSLLPLRRAYAQQSRPQRFVIREDRFGRMFPELDPFFRENTPSLRAALRDIGKLGGRLDARDSLIGDPANPKERNSEAAAVDLIVVPALSANNLNNPRHDGRQHIHRSVYRPRLDVRSDISSGCGDRTHAIAQRA